MNVYYNLNDLPKFKNSVITIGSFDGVHHGHQKIIERVNNLAKDIGGESILITFHPHPRVVIYPKDKSLKLLSSLEEKIALFEKYQLDNVVVVPFTVEFSQQSADEYIQKFLVEKFNPKFIVIGYDHRFGLNRQGDVNFLKFHGEQFDYKVVEIPQQEVADITVSSTKIRKALETGQVKAASELLNHNYSITGKVMHGLRIGHEIGFPTANIELTTSYKLVPPQGIYASYVNHKGKRYQSMLYIGHRPTIENHNERTIEVNIFDFNEDIYDEVINIEVIKFIRADEKFDGLEALKKQLFLDKENALAILSEIESASLQEKKKLNINLTPDVALVILNYNGQKFLDQFLAKISTSNFPRLKIYVADNGSSDDSVNFVKANFPKVRVLQLGENTGFAQGYNLALQQITSDYFILLNSDMEITNNWITPIIELMEKDKSIAACQPKIKAYHQKDHFEYAGAAGGWLDSLGYPFCRGRLFDINEKDTGQYDDTQEIFWATGAALIVRAKLFIDIGGFDRDYFAHSEEIDLCWRLKRAGYKIMCVPESVVYHVGGGTLNYLSERKTYLNFRNSLYTIFKNEPRSKLFWLIPLRFLLDGLAAGLFLVQGKFKHIWAILKAHFSFYKNLIALIKKRNDYSDLVEKVKISSFANKKGMYKGSIVWQFYIKGKKYFSELWEVGRPKSEDRRS